MTEKKNNKHFNFSGGRWAVLSRPTCWKFWKYVNGVYMLDSLILANAVIIHYLLPHGFENEPNINNSILTDYLWRGNVEAGEECCHCDSCEINTMNIQR